MLKSGDDRRNQIKTLNTRRHTPPFPVEKMACLVQPVLKFHGIENSMKSWNNGEQEEKKKSERKGRVEMSNGYQTDVV